MTKILEPLDWGNGEGASDALTPLTDPYDYQMRVRLFCQVHGLPEATARLYADLTAAEAGK